MKEAISYFRLPGYLSWLLISQALSYHHQAPVGGDLVDLAQQLGPKAGTTWVCSKFCRVQEKTVKSRMKKKTETPASRDHPIQSGWESRRKVSEAKVWHQGVSETMESSKQGQWRSGGMDWNGKGDCQDKGLTQGTMLTFAWMVFLKGPWFCILFWVVVTQVYIILKLIELIPKIFAFIVR